jgi:hypothetical protein
VRHWPDCCPSRGSAPGRRRPCDRWPAPGPTAGSSERGQPVVLRYPRLVSDNPSGPSPDNPMGEGSEETALPAVDLVDARLGQLRTPPDPLP